MQYYIDMARHATAFMSYESRIFDKESFVTLYMSSIMQPKDLTSVDREVLIKDFPFKHCDCWTTTLASCVSKPA